MITRSSFSAGYKRAQEELEVRLHDYLRSQGEEQVQSVSTAIRKFDRGSSLLPASVRKRKKLQRYRSRVRKLLRANNQIRDIDSISEHLSPMIAESRLAWLRAVLASERSGLEGPARQIASSVENPPVVDWDKVGGTKLQRRFRKVVRRAIDDLEEDLDVALKEPADLQTLHSLGIAVEELRHILEFAPKDGPSGSILRALEEWQDALEKIRDIDAMTAYAGGLELPEDLFELVRLKKEERRMLYLRFIDANKRPKLIAHLRSAIRR